MTHIKEIPPAGIIDVLRPERMVDLVEDEDTPCSYTHHTHTHANTVGANHVVIISRCTHTQAYVHKLAHLIGDTCGGITSRASAFDALR